MNEYDTDRIINALDAETTDNPKEADVIIVNTCAIREKADQKALSSLGRYKKLKSNNPDLVVGISGCVAQLYGDKLLKKMPYLDFVIGPRAIPKLPGTFGGSFRPLVADKGCGCGSQAWYNP